MKITRFLILIPVQLQQIKAPFCSHCKFVLNDIVFRAILVIVYMICVSDKHYIFRKMKITRFIILILVQQQQVKELYSLYLENISISELDGWICLDGTRKRI